MSNLVNKIKHKNILVENLIVFFLFTVFLVLKSLKTLSRIFTYGIFKKEILTFEEKNTTYRAKARYFELFPISGLKFLIPREVFILNKNLDAISALIILEDYCKTKFTLNQNINFKTWQK